MKLKIIMTARNSINLKLLKNHNLKSSESVCKIIYPFNKDLRDPVMSIFNVDLETSKDNRKILPSCLYHDDTNILLDVLENFINFTLVEKPIGSMDFSEKINRSFFEFDYPRDCIDVSCIEEKGINRVSYIYTFTEGKEKKYLEIHYYF